MNNTQNTTTFLLILSLFTFFSCNETEKDSVEIVWKSELQGDFSFQSNFSYSEGIYRNQFGQLVCDGLCPEATIQMIDSTGKIYQDSLVKYYQLVDTTHQYHNIECESNCYEFAGTNFVSASRTGNDTIVCQTMMSVSTHCSLVLKLIDGYCKPEIQLKSISKPGILTFPYKDGSISIDKGLWKQDTLKAIFDFTFEDIEKPEQKLFWRGRIYAPIK